MSVMMIATLRMFVIVSVTCLFDRAIVLAFSLRSPVLHVSVLFSGVAWDYDEGLAERPEPFAFLARLGRRRQNYPAAAAVSEKRRLSVVEDLLDYDNGHSTVKVVEIVRVLSASMGALPHLV